MFKRSKEQEKKGSEKREDLLVSFLKDAHFVFAIIKRGRRHKNKVVLEAERQAKAALDKVEKYAVLATIDKQELTFPLLNIKTPVQEAMDAVKKELAIPIPALIG